MKTAWAIVCSLLIAGAPLLLAQPVPSCANPDSYRGCCGHCPDMPCCKAKPPSDSKPAPAVPAPSGNQTQMNFELRVSNFEYSLFATRSSPFSIRHSSFAIRPPLFAQNCARLI